jgi:hypothetical protein
MKPPFRFRPPQSQTQSESSKFLLCGRDGASDRKDHIHFEPDKLCCNIGIAFATSFRPTIFDRNGAPLGPAEFVQSLHKSGSPLAKVCSRPEIRWSATCGPAAPLQQSAAPLRRQAG